MPFPVNNIRKACSKKGITLAELERELKIGNGVIAKWEKARRYPPIDRIKQIADYLEVSVPYLTGEEQKEKTPVITEEDEGFAACLEIARRIRKLSPNALKDIEHHLDIVESLDRK